MERRKALLFLGFSAALAAGCAGSPPRPSGMAGTPSGAEPGTPPSDGVPPGPDPHAGSRAEVVLQALAQLGTPYVWGGTSPHIGFDCSGLVAYVYRQAAQLALPRITYDQARVSRSVEARDLRPADLVFYNTLRRDFSHVGIFIGEARFIHAPAARGVVRIEDMRVDYWRGRFNGARRLLG